MKNDIFAQWKFNGNEFRWRRVWFPLTQSLSPAMRTEPVLKVMAKRKGEERLEIRKFFLGIPVGWITIKTDEMTGDYIVKSRDGSIYSKMAKELIEDFQMPDVKNIVHV